MAKAETIHITGERPILHIRENGEARAAQSARHAHAFFSMESEICDLLVMAQIASAQVYSCIGDLKCENGEPVELPTGDSVQAALFATAHIVQMLKKLRDDYYRNFEAPAH